jgi:hypothetical protein
MAFQAEDPLRNRAADGLAVGSEAAVGTGGTGTDTGGTGTDTGGTDTDTDTGGTGTDTANINKI